MVRALLFDLDGTLLDTSKGIFRTADKSAISLGIKPCRDYVKYAQFVGPPLHVGFNKVYGLSGKEAFEAARIYKSFYPETGLNVYEYYSGLVDVFKELRRRGYLIGISTLKNEGAAKRMIASSLFAPYIDVIHGSDEAETLGKGDIVALCLSDLSVLPSEAVLIGDSESDESGAGKAGVGFLAVSWGFGFPSGYDGLEYIDKPEELLEKYKGVIAMIEKVETKNAPAAIGPYSQAVKVNGMLYCSGQIPIDPVTGNIVEGDVKAQAEQVFKNIKAVLAEAGTDETKVVKATVFLKSMDDFAAVNEVYASFFSSSSVLPARSAVAVQKLPKDVMVEVEVIAVL